MKRTTGRLATTAALLLAWAGTPTVPNQASEPSGPYAVQALGVQAPAPAFQVQSVSLGLLHVCAIDVDKRAWCWGQNHHSALGLGSADFDRRARWPEAVIGLTDPVVAVAAGAYHTCALTALGAAKCWGDNNTGQLGNGKGGGSDSLADEPAPVDVIGLQSGVAAIAAGYLHSCALLRTGAVYCWGRDLIAWEDRNLPMAVAGLETGVAALASSMVHMCVLMTTGEVRCWGGGDGLPGDGPGLATIPDLDQVTALAAGLKHNCALTRQGGVKCWGDNTYGQLGDGSTTARKAPADVAGLDHGVTVITAGGAQTCAVVSSGDVWCWGINEAGQLGLGTTDRNAHPRPVRVPGLAGPARTVVTSMTGDPDIEGPCELEDCSDRPRHGFTCAILLDRRLQCWGGNAEGELGAGTFVSRPRPADVFRPLAQVLLPALVR